MSSTFLWNVKTMTIFFLKSYRRSGTFAYFSIFFILISVLMSILSVFFLHTLINNFVPGSLKVSHYPHMLVESIYNFIWGNIAIYLPVLATAFFGANAISVDLEDRSIYTFISMPISREEYLLSKIISSFTSSFLLVLIYVAFQFASFIILFHSLPGFSFLNYLLLTMLVIFTDTIISLNFSVIIKKGSYAPIAYIISFLLIFNIISLLFSSFSLGLPSLVLSNAQRDVFLVFLNVDPFFLVYSGALASIPYLSEVMLVYVQLIYTLFASLFLYLLFIRRGAIK